MKMSICSVRSGMCFILLIQLISIAERQIFDFLGYMWIPILCNFFGIIFGIFGLFGIHQRRVNYIIVYLVWSLIWIGWNIFVICYYLEVGILHRSHDVFSFGTGSFSWWLINGLKCKPEYFHINEANGHEFDESNRFHPIRPSRVTMCLVEYQHVEAIHAIIQLLFSFLGVTLGAINVRHYILTNDDKQKLASKAMYSIEYSPQIETTSASTIQETDLYAQSEENRPQMTPRRVKRRSYTRNSARAASTRMYAGGGTRKSNGRNSTRSCGARSRTAASNPVTLLLDADGAAGKHTVPVLPGDSSTSNDDNNKYGAQINTGFECSRPNSLYSLSGGGGGNINRQPADEVSRPPSALTSYSNFHGQRRTELFSNPSNREPKQNILSLAGLTQSALNSSFDDLPPPPPPISSSPTPAEYTGSDLVNNSTSAATAQVPVPQQRIHQPRRNEYVNMPVPDQPEPTIDKSQRSHFSPPHSYMNTNGPLASYINDVGGSSSQNSSDQFSYLSPPNSLSSGQPPPSINSDHKHFTSNANYNETQTLRADTKLVYHPASGAQSLAVNSHFSSGVFAKQNGNIKAPKLSPSVEEPLRRIPTGHQLRDRHSLRAKHKRDLELQQMAAGKKNTQEKSKDSFPPPEDEYGFTSKALQPLNNINHNGGAIPKVLTASKNGYYASRSKTPDKIDEQWYLHDSMKPVGATRHGPTCQCYRCQRKLTVI